MPLKGLSDVTLGNSKALLANLGRSCLLDKGRADLTLVRKGVKGILSAGIPTSNQLASKDTRFLCIGTGIVPLMTPA